MVRRHATQPIDVIARWAIDEEGGIKFGSFPPVQRTDFREHFTHPLTVDSLSFGLPYCPRGNIRFGARTGVCVRVFEVIRVKSSRKLMTKFASGKAGKKIC